MPKMKLSYSRQLYFSGQESLDLLARCEKILEREKNWSFNKLVEEALKEYEVRHGNGNNSFQLDKFGITWTTAQSTSKCGFNGCGNLAVGVGLYKPKKQTLGLCRKHFMLVSDNPLWSAVKSGES